MAKARLRTNATIRIRNIPEDTLNLVLELIEEEGAKYAIVDQFRTGEHLGDSSASILRAKEQSRVRSVRNATGYQSKVHKSLEA